MSLYIELQALENGAHRNQRGDMLPAPDGWLEVPPEMEEEAWGYLPFIELTVEDGAITAVAQGEIPEPETEPEAPISDIALLKAQINALIEQNAFLEDCMTELILAVLE